MWKLSHAWLFFWRISALNVFRKKRRVGALKNAAILDRPPPPMRSSRDASSSPVLFENQKLTGNARAMRNYYRAAMARINGVWHMDLSPHCMLPMMTRLGSVVKPSSSGLQNFVWIRPKASWWFAWRRASKIPACTANSDGSSCQETNNNILTIRYIEPIKRLFKESERGQMSHPKSFISMVWNMDQSTGFRVVIKSFSSA